MKAPRKPAAPTPAPAELCANCGNPRNGKGGKGLCARCYMADYRGQTPSVERQRRAPGTWNKVQVHLGIELEEEFRKEAKRARQTIGRWLEDAIREKLRRDRG